MCCRLIFQRENGERSTRRCSDPYFVPVYRVPPYDLLHKLIGFIEIYGIEINCTSIGEDSDLLRDIAKASEGEYWFIP